MDLNDKLQEWKMKLEQASQYDIFVDSAAVGEMIRTIEMQAKIIESYLRIEKDMESDYESLQVKNKRYEDALIKIATRKMSVYLSPMHMNIDFIKIAKEALNNITE